MSSVVVNLVDVVTQGYAASQNQCGDTGRRRVSAVAEETEHLRLRVLRLRSPEAVRPSSGVRASGWTDPRWVSTRPSLSRSRQMQPGELVSASYVHRGRASRSGDPGREQHPVRVSVESQCPQDALPPGSRIHRGEHVLDYQSGETGETVPSLHGGTRSAGRNRGTDSASVWHPQFVCNRMSMRRMSRSQSLLSASMA